MRSPFPWSFLSGNRGQMEEAGNPDIRKSSNQPGSCTATPITRGAGNSESPELLGQPETCVVAKANTG